MKTLKFTMALLLIAAGAMWGQYTPPAGGGGGGAPSGPAGGGLAGTYPNPTLARPNLANGPVVLDGSGNAGLPGNLTIAITVLGPKTIGAGANQVPAASTVARGLTIITDGASASDCTSGGGSTVVPCFSNGTVWGPLAAAAMTYPGAGIPNSTGSAWGTSYGVSGSGSVCLTTNCAMATPNLGTPSAVVLTNGTGYPASALPAAPLPTPGASCTFTGTFGYCVCTTTCTITVPVPAAGYQFCAVNDDNVTTAITLSALGSSASYESTARTGYGTAGTGTLAATSGAINAVCMLGRDSTHYLTLTSTGSWTAN